MNIRKPLAALAVASLCITGVGATAGAATASEASERTVTYVPYSKMKRATNQEHQTDVYNVWHLDPDHRVGASEARNGLMIGADADILALKGNGNDQPGTVSQSKTDILELAESLDIVATSDAALYFQVPVFWDKVGGGNGFTSLRKPVASNEDIWTTSGAINAEFGKNATGTLEELTEAIEEFENARPIAAGFLSAKNPAANVISSFTAGNETTKFYAEPSEAEIGALRSEYVSDAYIREDETSYAGWHNGDSSGRSYVTVQGDAVGQTDGLRVEGKTQIFNGFADEDFQANAVAKVADMEIDADGPVWAQIGVWSWAETLVSRQWTTLRALVPASGRLADATGWTSSRDLVGPFGDIAVPKNTELPLAEIIAALGDHDVTGYGAFVDTGETALIRAIEFDNLRTNFAKQFIEGASSVPLSTFAHPTTPAEQTEVYNMWHFDQDHRGDLVTQQLDGIHIPAGDDVLALEGTGLDAAGTVSHDEQDVRDLALSLEIDATSTDELYFQVPVFWDKPGGGNGFTTLRKPVDSTDEQWTTSGAIGTAFAKGATASLEDLTTAIEEFANARPIAAGFLAYNSESNTVVKSFTAGGMVSSFAAQPDRSKVAASSIRAVYNSVGTVIFSVTAPEGVTPSGTVKAVIGGKTQSATVLKGKATIKIPTRLNAGKYRATVTFVSGDPVVLANSTATVNVTVAKATPVVKAKLSKSKIRVSDRAKLSITTAVPGTLNGKAAGVKYSVYDGSKRIATGSLNTAGAANVTLKGLKKGAHKLVVKLSAGANTNAKNSSRVTLRVR